MYFQTPLGKLKKSSSNGNNNWIKTFPFLSSVYFFLVSGVACEIECVETNESTNVLYVSVKVNLYNQTE